MLLLMDMGNTALKLCAWGGGPRARWSLPSGRGLEASLPGALDSFRRRFGMPRDCVIASVVPDGIGAVRAAVARAFGLDLLVVARDWPSDVRVCLQHPETMGLDRYVDAVAAAGLCPGQDRIVIDYGTATTYDLVLRDGRFVAGLICAGAGSCARALHEMTAQLPLVPVGPPPGGVLADNTRDSMAAGVFYSLVGETRHLVAELRAAAGLQDAAVLSTGGFGELMKTHSGVIDAHHPDLMFVGMARLHRFFKGGL